MENHANDNSGLEQLKYEENNTKVGVTNILFVDDETSCHHFVDFMLNDIYPEFIVKKAETGEEAIEIAKNLTEKVDILLLDFMLPDMDGYQLYQELQQVESTKNVPVIFQTGLGALNSDVKELISANKAAVVFKPYDAEKLKLAIHNITYK